ncbi:Protein Aster-C [Entomophthora muscae]|uniref:Protein Aster-C n=1 Tax=Entomophthora muscae TaxID=34485 RepID=A0ACC2U4W4_9FUNG|nr:Protein Aster-C [Entomophthora muscae]
MDGLFGKNDAYAIVKVGEQTQKTNIIENAGKEATWDESFNFSIVSDDEVAIEVYDSDNIQDDLIGLVKIPLDAVFQDKKVEKRYPLSRGANNAGEVLDQSCAFLPGSSRRES